MLSEFNLGMTLFELFSSLIVTDAQSSNNHPVYSIKPFQFTIKENVDHDRLFTITIVVQAAATVQRVHLLYVTVTKQLESLASVL